VLPRVHRVTTGDQFRVAVRDGRRAGSRLLVLHLALDAGSLPGAPTVGFVVSKAVGKAVTRNRVKRRLRHLVAERLDRLPTNAVLVVRAQPAAATASSGELGDDLDRTLANVLAKLSGRPSTGPAR
jgi:ribonuclease P protein component